MLRLIATLEDGSMTATNDKLAEMMRVRIAEIDVERDQLVSLLGHYTNGVSPASRMVKARNGGFKPRSGGATESLLQAVRENPGLSYTRVLDKALEGLQTDSEHPRRSLGSTLGTLVRRGKIRKSDDKKYYPVTGAAVV